MRTRNRDDGKSFQPRRRSGVADYRRRMFPLNNETCAVREELSHYVETVTMYLFLFPSPLATAPVYQDNNAISKPSILEGGRVLIPRNRYFVTSKLLLDFHDVFSFLYR